MKEEEEEEEEERHTFKTLQSWKISKMKSHLR
jgi:hypothetical protein